MPEAVAAAVVSWLGATGATAAIVSATVQVALYAGLNAVVQNNSKQKDQGQLINLQLNSAAPRQLVIGKRLVGGTLVDWYVNGTDNTKLYLPVYLSEGPCGQIKRVYAGGRLVYDSPLSHGVRTTIPDFRSGGDRLWLTYYDGRAGQTADPTLVGLSQGWTSANKMTGCAWVLVECQWDSDNMRSPPELSFEMEGAKLYDRRKDSTAGGSGSHRIDNPATWEWSDNPAVALDHYMLGRYLGSVKTFGVGLSSDEVPYSYFAAQANVCDEDVDLKAGGTQKRYRANGFIGASEDYSSVITKLCTAMAARAADFGGRFGVIGMESRTPVMTIDDGDLIADAPEIYTPKRSWSELVGEVEGRFQDPAQLYQATPYPNVTDATWADEDGGEPKMMTLDLEFEVDVERAQRLATLKARAERRQATLRGVYPLKCVELERGDWFIRTGDRFGDTGKTFEVLERVLNTDAWTVSIVAQEVDAADSAWDETTAQDGPPAPVEGTDTIAAIQVPSITVSAVTLTGTAASIPALKVQWTSPTDIRVRSLYIECENTDGTTPKTTKLISLPADVNSVVFQDGIVDGDGYAVSAKFLTDTIPSDWCVATIVSASGTYAVGSAASVPWSGVSSRPANLSALSGSEAINNALAALGENAAPNTELRTPGTYPPTAWETGTGNASPAPSRTIITSGARAVIQGAVTGTPTNGQFFDLIRMKLALADLQANALPVVPGDKVAASSMVAHNSSVTNVAGQIVWYNASGTFISQTALSTVTNVADGSTGDPANFALSSGLGTAPANARYAILILGRCTCNGGANPTAWGFAPLLAKVPSTQTVVPAYTPGKVIRQADQTSANTAAAITGQAAAATDSTIQSGATKNTLTYSSSAPSSPTNGDLWGDTSTTPIVWKVRVSGAWQSVASLGGVFGSTLLETGGGSAATLANFKTALGVASAIASQGGQATANAQRGATYSGTPVEGSWWADTSTNKLKFYTGGAWQTVATLLSDAAAGVLSVSFSPSSHVGSHTGAGSLSTTAVTATPAGGSGTYTYAWSVESVMSGNTPTLTNIYTATVGISLSYTAIGTADGTLKCVVTDTVTGKQVTRYWGYYDEGTGGGGGAGGGGGLPP